MEREHSAGRDRPPRRYSRLRLREMDKTIDMSCRQHRHDVCAWQSTTAAAAKLADAVRQIADEVQAGRLDPEGDRRSTRSPSTSIRPACLIRTC